MGVRGAIPVGVQVLLLFRAGDRFLFNAKAPRWLNPRRSMMVISRVIDAAFAVQVGWVWGAEVLASCRKATGAGMLEIG